MAVQKKKKRGPKPLPPDQGKRVPLNMRTTKELREKMEAAAVASGRSIAQEVEHRLEQSFQGMNLLQSFLSDPEYLGRVLRLLKAKSVLDAVYNAAIDDKHTTPPKRFPSQWHGPLYEKAMAVLAANLVGEAWYDSDVNVFRDMADKLDAMDTDDIEHLDTIAPIASDLAKAIIASRDDPAAQEDAGIHLGLVTLKCFLNNESQKIGKTGFAADGTSITTRLIVNDPKKRYGYG